MNKNPTETMYKDGLFFALRPLFKPQRTGVKISAGDTILAILLGLLGFKFICQLLPKSFIWLLPEGLFRLACASQYLLLRRLRFTPQRLSAVRTFHIK